MKKINFKKILGGSTLIFSSGIAGFTLIELLVVIAVVSLLSSIIFSSLNSTRGKGADAAVKENLINARSQAELFYYNNGNKYSGTLNSADDVCSSLATGSATGGVQGIYPFLLAAKNASGATVIGAGTGQDNTKVICNSISSAWAVQSPLKNGGAFCVDSAGISRAIVEANVNLLSGNTFCPNP